MKLISLQSGSNGNCIYVQARGVQLMFDAGISGSQAQQRLDGHGQDIGQDIGQVDALLVSHNHRDHARSMGIFQRNFGLPIHVTRPTLAGSPYPHSQPSTMIAPSNVREYGNARRQTPEHEGNEQGTRCILVAQKLPYTASGSTAQPLLSPGAIPCIENQTT
jgi:metal-dependent hydrolase (beta-lactamase superfamily II)